jgi:DNA-binding SARP family transcriptional activator
LFAFLAVNRARPATRETLAEHLWSTSTETQARKYLRQTIWQLQAALSSSDRSPGAFFTIDTDSIQLNPRADVWLDVRFFEDASIATSGVAGSTLSAEQAATLRRAVDMYQGDLLEGWYQDWCLFERERLQLLYLSMLDKLVTYEESRQSFESAVIFAEQILRHDRAHERAHQRLMRLHYLAGDRTAALRQFDKCVAALASELDVAPARETKELREQIRHDHLETALPEHELLRQAPDPIGALKRVMTQLTALHDLLEAELGTLEHPPSSNS